MRLKRRYTYIYYIKKDTYNDKIDISRYSDKYLHCCMFRTPKIKLFLETSCKQSHVKLILSGALIKFLINKLLQVGKIKSVLFQVNLAFLFTNLDEYN